MDEIFTKEQTSKTAILTERITWSKVKKFLRDYDITNAQDFSRIKSICYDPQDTSYHTHQKIFDFNHPIEQVWHAYKTIDPARAWSGDMIHFGLQYSRIDHSVIYAGDNTTTGLQGGQVLILNLKLVGGAIQLCVGHEIKEVNEAEKVIKICYLENSASQGSQFIRLTSTPQGTRVTHDTFYKSNSWFRDRILYPGLHTKALKEFHGNVRMYLEKVSANQKR
jgi:hypothetical protein